MGLEPISPIILSGCPTIKRPRLLIRALYLAPQESQAPQGNLEEDFRNRRKSLRGKDLRRGAALVSF